VLLLIHGTGGSADDRNVVYEGGY